MATKEQAQKIVDEILENDKEIYQNIVLMEFLLNSAKEKNPKTDYTSQTKVLEQVKKEYEKTQAFLKKYTKYGQQAKKGKADWSKLPERKVKKRLNGLGDTATWIKRSVQAVMLLNPVGQVALVLSNFDLIYDYLFPAKDKQEKIKKIQEEFIKQVGQEAWDKMTPQEQKDALEVIYKHGVKEATIQKIKSSVTGFKYGAIAGIIGLVGLVIAIKAFAK